MTIHLAGTSGDGKRLLMGGARDDGPTWSYDRWTRELARCFFGQADASEVVTFCADGPSLAALMGTSEDVAKRSLQDAVSAIVMPNYQFGNIGTRAVEWERSGMDGPSPALPLLALTVLAASLMQREEGVAPHNFYRQLRHLLDETDDERGIPGDFDPWLPRLWRQLARWLNEHLDGANGVLVLPPQETLDRNPYAKNIGYALQQAIFRISDRRHLYRFFRDIGVEVGVDDAEPTELRRALALWAPRHEPGAARLTRLATEPLFESYSLDLLGRLANGWDGRLVEESSGKPEEVLRLRLELRPIQLTLIAARDERMPTTTVVNGPRGELRLEAAGSWFKPMPLPIELTADLMEQGCRIASDTVALAFQPRPLHAFRYDEFVGAWVDVDLLRFGELHHLLVRGELRTQLTAFCQSESPEARLDPQATQKLPTGWFLIRDFRLDRRPSAPPPAPLASLLRSGGGARMRLVGGLKLPHLHHAYLTGGAPFLALPEGIDARTFELHRQGGDKPLSFVARGSEFPLGVLNLDDGHYEIRYGPARIDFDLITGIVERSGEGSGTIATEGTVGVGSGTQESPPRSVIAPVDEEICVLIGPCSEDIELIHKPQWLSELVGGGGLSWKQVDAWLDFEPVWRLTRPIKGQTEYEAEQVGVEQPEPGPVGGAWSSILRRAHPSPSDSECDEELWQLYKKAAGAQP